MSLISLLSASKLPNPLVCDAAAETATIYVSLDAQYEFIIDPQVFNVGSCNQASDIEYISESGSRTKSVTLQPCTGEYGADSFKIIIVHR